jgi:5-oxoprolinase (ATP-hydrolysing) subunit A
VTTPLDPDAEQPAELLVDLNADLGEEITDDAALLAVVTSANVACGYHAGSRETMRIVCAEAARLGVSIGAQVSYDDRINFGRVARDVPFERLRDQVADQVGTLVEVALLEGAVVRYVKPHGALYHRVAEDPDQAAAVLEGSGVLPVLGLPGAVLLALAVSAGRATWHEGFPDRGYLPDGGLVPRDRPGAVLTDSGEIARRAVRLARDVDSVCVHGDTPGAVDHARAVREALLAAGFRLAGL